MHETNENDLYHGFSLSGNVGCNSSGNHQHLSNRKKEFHQANSINCLPFKWPNTHIDNTINGVSLLRALFSFRLCFIVTIILFVFDPTMSPSYVSSEVHGAQFKMLLAFDAFCLLCNMVAFCVEKLVCDCVWSGECVIHTLQGHSVKTQSIKKEVDFDWNLVCSTCSLIF